MNTGTASFSLLTNGDYEDPMGQPELSPIGGDAVGNFGVLQQQPSYGQQNPPLSLSAMAPGPTMNHPSPGQPTLQSPQQQEHFATQNVQSPQSQHSVDLSSVLSDINQDYELYGMDLVVPEVQPLPENVTNDPESPYLNQGSKIFDLIENGSDAVKNEIDRMWLDCRESVFTITIRRHFADVIDCMRWDKISPQDENGVAHKLTNELYGRIHQQVRSNEFARDHEFRYALQRLLDKLANPYSQATIAQQIKEVMNREKSIIEHSGRVSGVVPQMQGMRIEPDDYLRHVQAISSDLDTIENQCHQTASSIEAMTTHVQELQLQLQGRLRFIDMITTEGWSQVQREHLQNAVNRRNGVLENINQILRQLWNTQEHIGKSLKKVLDEELKEYQRNQAYINNGRFLSHYCSINQLQDWCKKLAKIISSNLQFMEKLQFLAQQLGLDSIQPQNNQPSSWQYVNELKSIFSRMIEELVGKGLIVDKNPPQVLMKDKRFQSTLRHLVGDALDIHQLNFRVTVHLINAEEATRVLTEGAAAEFKESGKILNNEATSDYLNHAGILSVNMRNMCLKMQQRGAQRAQEMVAELKFAMLFRASIIVRYHSHQTTVTAQALSLPIVVISHGKQEADAQATIFWDNAFAKVNRKPFDVDESVQWSDMLDALDGRWKKECDEGPNTAVVGLTPQAKQYLTMKVFNRREVHHGTMITWQKFNHDKMQAFAAPDSRRELFTFWTWFFKAMELCSSQHIKKYWNKGYICGFINKTDCQDLLLKAAAEMGQSGTFLFRFSETKLGAISISCTSFDRDRMAVRNLEPDDIKKFQIRSLPDMLNDLPYLTHLYPNIQKDFAFGQFYSQPEAVDGYLPKPFKVAVVVPQKLFDNPDTPQSMGFPDHDAESP